MAMREKDQADFDLERFIDMFDTAMTSDDPRIKNALRQLLMMVILTEPEDKNAGAGLNHRSGPLRRLFEDVRSLSSRLHNLDDQFHRLDNFARATAIQTAQREGTRQKYPGRPEYPGYPEQWDYRTAKELLKELPEVQAKTTMEQAAIPGAKTLLHGHK